MSESELQELFAKHKIHFNKIRGQFDRMQANIDEDGDIRDSDITEIFWYISMLFRIYTENDMGYMDRVEYDDLVYDHLGGDKYGGTGW